MSIRLFQIGGREGGNDTGSGSVTWNSILGRPTTFPSTIPLVTGLQTELSDIRATISEGGSANEISSLADIPWQTGAINGHVLWTGGNVGLNFGEEPNATGLQECGIQARSSMTSMLLRGSGRLDSLNRAFFFRPNSANEPTQDDMILFADGRLNARVYSEDGTLLSDKYTVRLADNAFDANAPITSYPMGRSIHFHSQAPTQSGFPYGTTMIETNQFHDTGIQYATNLVTGARSRRIWSGISWQGWNVEPTMSILEKLCEKLDIDINKIMEEEAR